MSSNEKTLYVKSLVGAEKAREAKGGQGREVAASPDEIIRKIDDAYASGATEDAGEIFSTLARRPDSQPQQRPASP